MREEREWVWFVGVGVVLFLFGYIRPMLQILILGIIILGPTLIALGVIGLLADIISSRK